ncbi:MAG: D-cysteine desulfhydrase family protein [Gammaproteobacteria bacterium]|nr:D-cysteine desulfhydrase family protein [Gammaproteobacteria bacterium]
MNEPDWLSAVPRLSIGHLPTPFEPLDRLSRELGGPRIWVKRDDCTGLATGGNKTRKLEYLLADARLKGATDIITFGAVQSNHARQTAMAAARLGFPCHLILTEQVSWKNRSYATSGNVLIDRIAGAEVMIVPPDAAAEATSALTSRLTEQGRSPYLIPAGGSNATGAFGYVRAAWELLGDCERLGLQLRHVVHASSSAGTQSGLIYGFSRLGREVRVTGVNVYHDKPATLETRIGAIISTLAERHGAIAPPRIHVTDRYRGKAYGLPTDAGLDAIRMFARFEGLLFDPVYSGKAAAAMIDLISVGEFSGEDDVVLIHTGGQASLSVYDNAFTS